jgi:hypothetical protein
VGTSRAQEVQYVPAATGEADLSGPESPPRVFTRDDMLAALEGQPLIIRRIVYCECKYDPNVIVYRRDGSPLYYGCAQLMTGRGNGYDIFQRWGFTDWRDPEQVVAFLNEVVRRGMLGSQYPRTQYGCPGSP